MDEMNAVQLAVFYAEQNMIRKILEILEKSKDIDEAVEKVKALLKS